MTFRSLNTTALLVASVFSLHAQVVPPGTGAITSGAVDYSWYYAANSIAGEPVTQYALAYLVTGLPPGWHAASAGTKWIGPAPDQTNTTRGGACCGGSTTYGVYFDGGGSGFTMFLCADDNATVVLNDHTLYSGTGQQFLVGAAIAVTQAMILPGGRRQFPPAAGVIWSTAPSFAQGLMPTQIGGVSVTVNGKAAYMYYYCSAVTSTCASDQVNVLSPLDNTAGPVQIVVTSGATSSAPFTALMNTNVPSFFLFSGSYVVATHANQGLLGPTTLYPGLSTPAAKDEEIVIWGTGFGLPSAAITPGSSVQSGSLPVLPVCKIGVTNAVVEFAGLVATGLFQVNMTVPNTAATTGNLPIVCTYNGASTPGTDLVTAQ